MRPPALGLALLLCLAGGCGDDPAASSPGQIVQGRLGDLSGTDFSVLVPTGEITVRLSDGADALDAGDAADAQEHDAPSGTHWVGIDWNFLPGADYDPFVRTLMDDPAARTTLALEASGETIELGDAASATSTPPGTRTSGIVYVAIDKDAVPVLRVTFDGVTTRVDSATGDIEGEEAPALDDLAVPRVRECRALTARSRKTAEVACSYVVTRVPYLAGQGWGSGGWTVAQVETRAAEFEIGASTYAVQNVDDASTLDDGLPESTVVSRQRDSLVTRIVTRGSAQQLKIVRTLTGARTSGPGPDDATITVTASATLR